MRRFLIVAAVVAAGLVADAAGKGKPGGGGSAPSGTIYFTDSTSSYAIGSMNADGSGATTLSAVDVNAQTPTYGLHGGKRWFLFRRPVSGTNPDTAGKVALFAEADDGTEVQLTDGTIRVFDVAWGRDDSFVSFVGIEWYGSGMTDADSHVFVADIGWGSGAPTLVTAPSAVVTGAVYGTDNLRPDFEHPDWSPDAAEVVYTRGEAGSYPGRWLEVATVGGSTRDLGLYGHDPEWAPDGSRIAFDNHDDLFTIEPDGSGVVQLTTRTGTRWHWRAHWSPDSAHLALTRVQQKGTVFTSAVARIPASGGSLTVVRENASAFAWR